jgi:ADP-ribose pyrophosphatase YjhB (NUDIX family)
MKKRCKRYIIRYGYGILVLWWFLSRPNTQGVKALIFCSHKVLLVRPSYSHQKWTVPGGGVKHSELSKAAVIRELREETGLATELTYFFEYKQKVEFKNDLVNCFYGFSEDENVVIDNEEIIDFIWSPLDSLPADRSPSVDKIIKAYKIFVSKEGQTLANK